MALSSKVYLDTNMLTAVFQLKIDVFDEIRKMLGNVEFIIPKQAVWELERISKRKGIEGRKAKFALQLLGKENVGIEKIDAENCDDALLKISCSAIVATNDKALKRKIIENRGKVIFIRQKKFIELEG